MKKWTAAILFLTFLLVQTAIADTIYMDGTVKATEKHIVFAPIGGVIGNLHVDEGDEVEVGDDLISLRTNVTYADQSGIVAFYGEPGDRAEAVGEEYGAVAVVNPDSRFKITTSTRQAYDDNSLKVIQSGTTVYLYRSSNKETGVGILYDVNGQNFSVRVISGNFELGDTISIYRDAALTYESRLGRGDIEMMDPVLYSGEGSIVSLFATTGNWVRKGDPLFETLDGTFDNHKSTGKTVKSDETGVVSSISVSIGDKISKDQVILEIWPQDSMRVIAQVSELDLPFLSVGDTVTIRFDAYSDDPRTGTVEKISQKASAENDGKNTKYDVTIRFDNTGEIRFGMAVEVTFTTK